MDVKVPDIGDFKDVPVVTVLVSVGDTVSAEDPLIELESDKATMEVPSPAAGKITEIKVAEGDRVSEGTVIMVLESADAKAEDAPKAADAAPVAPQSVAATGTASGKGDVHAEVVVLGSGPGGYTAAFRAADLGKKVVLIEKYPSLGGVCLNVGCIPSKALLHASHMLHEAEHNFAAMGLKGKTPSVDWKQMMAYKEDTIGQNTKGIEFLFKKNKIDWIKGWAAVPAAGQVKVGDEVHTAKNIIIASGSEPASLPGVEVDEKVVVTSTGALELGKVPKKMVVIGAGVIGLELGSVYSRLGSEVTVIEYLDAITPGMDGEIQKTFQRILKKQGLTFVMGAAVQKTDATKTKAKVTYKLRKDDSEHVLDADVVLLATGRKPYTDGLGLDALGIEMSPRGQINVGADWQTNVKGIYAIGDCIDGPMLAHKAEDEGMAVAEQVAGKHGHVNYGVIPGVIYTHPEVANVGETEQ